MQSEKTIPTLARTLAILNLVLGGIGMLSLPCGAAALFVESPKNPMLSILRRDQALFAWNVAHLILGALLLVLSLVGSAALLKALSWSRPLLIAQTSASLLFGVIGVFSNIFFVSPRLLEASKHLPAAAKAGAIGGFFGGTIGGVVSLALPAITLFAVTRPELKAALASPEKQGDSPYPPSL